MSKFTLFMIWLLVAVLSFWWVYFLEIEDGFKHILLVILSMPMGKGLYYILAG